MLNPLIRSLVKIAVASLIVGTILAHFGISAEQLMKEAGLSVERIEDMARRGLKRALGPLRLGREPHSTAAKRAVDGYRDEGDAHCAAGSAAARTGAGVGVRGGGSASSSVRPT